jgi:hypothetical protein
VAPLGPERAAAAVATAVVTIFAEAVRESFSAALAAVRCVVESVMLRSGTVALGVFGSAVTGPEERCLLWQTVGLRHGDSLCLQERLDTAVQANA